MATIEEVIHDLDSFIVNWKTKGDEVPFEIKTSIITQIIKSRSIDEARFVQAVDFRESELVANGSRYLIDAKRDEEVTYDGFVEVEGERRRWVGRWNYREGIESSDIESVSDEISNMSFAR